MGAILGNPTSCRRSTLWGEGDLDLTLCSRLSPHEAVAIECKRVNFEAQHLKPFSSLLFPVSRTSKYLLKQPSLGNEFCVSLLLTI
jgi:hypothetical protein